MPWEKQFDVDAALDQAIGVFWERGYAQTSMPELLAAMGINRGSFYDTYGSKHAVLKAAIHRYAGQRFEQFKRLIHSGGPRAAIRAMFAITMSESTGKAAQHGCLAVNCALEMAPLDAEIADLVREVFTHHQQLLAAWVVAGQEQGEITPDHPADEIAYGLLALLMGMRVMARAGMPRSCMDAIIQQVDALLGNPMR